MNSLRTCNVYVSDWGEFLIPDKYAGIRWTWTGLPDRRFTKQKELVEEFRAWVHAEEVKLGKPEKAVV